MPQTWNLRCELLKLVSRRERRDYRITAAYSKVSYLTNYSLFRGELSNSWVTRWSTFSARSLMGCCVAFGGLTLRSIVPGSKWRQCGTQKMSNTSEIADAATQRPSSDIILPSLRDLFAWRFAGRCTNDVSSDIILGHGWAARGFSSNTVDVNNQGCGYLISESGIPALVKAAFMRAPLFDIGRCPSHSLEPQSA